jgi:hypothetical protein
MSFILKAIITMSHPPTLVIIDAKLYLGFSSLFLRLGEHVNLLRDLPQTLSDACHLALIILYHFDQFGTPL